ncbi:MAG: diguanylate cyclase [Candidatus Aminicenantes bacterium]|nr:diguanylate cyclase [Candidatus Aminicenantes bacterium]
MKKIISLCLSLDQIAEKVYDALASVAEVPWVRELWRKMHEEEKTHVLYWLELEKEAESNNLPQLFDDPDKLVEELEKIKPVAEALLEQARSSPKTSESFLLAARLEMHLMHPAFLYLFRFVKQEAGSTSPIKNYESHLLNFNRHLLDLGKKSLYFQVLGESFQKMWIQTQEQLNKSFHDVLTGILNRRGLFHSLDIASHLAQRSNSQVAVVMIDIDDFKNLNDSFGHYSGDRVLSKVAVLLKKNIRTSDILGRYGGEEFLIFLSPVNVNSIFGLADKLRKCIAGEVRDPRPVTISIGVSSGRIVGDVQRALYKLIREADENLYQAKSQGKNRVVF